MKRNELDQLKKQLEILREMLDSHGERYLSQMINQAINGTEDDLIAFLKSNELWGGAGSIADQAGLDESLNIRRDVESALVELGEAQIKSGVVNVRTEFWVRGSKKILDD